MAMRYTVHALIVALFALTTGLQYGDTMATPTGNRGVIAGKSDGTDLRYAYDEPVEFQLDLSPYNGSWISDEAASSKVRPFPNATPPQAHVDTVSATAIAVSPVIFSKFAVADAPGTVYSVSGITIKYNRNAAGDDIIFSLMRKARSGDAAAATVFSYSKVEFTTTGAWTAFVDNSVAHDFDFEAYNYFWKANYQPVASPSDAALSDVNLRITKKAVE